VVVGALEAADVSGRSSSCSDVTALNPSEEAPYFRRRTMASEGYVKGPIGYLLHEVRTPCI
jgi:hypothetical protein